MKLLKKLFSTRSLLDLLSIHLLLCVGFAVGRSGLSGEAWRQFAMSFTPALPGWVMLLIYIATRAATQAYKTSKPVRHS